MENAKRNRDIKRTALEGTIGDALTLIGRETPNIKELQAILPQISRCRDRYLTAVDELLEKMLKAKNSVEEITSEEMLQNAIYGKTEGVMLQIEDRIQELKYPTQPLPPDDDVVSLAGSITRSQGHHRLPKLELPKFGGEARDWLAFWSAFQTVHEDNSITPAVKLQYLTNCMIPGSVAQEIVASYPATPENYEEAVLSLTERYGRPDMLVEVYVRDLIALILENAQKPSSSSSLYVKLSTQLRALGSLGVTTAKCAAILLPMVESALPEDILLAWQRCRPHIPVEKKEKTSEIMLEKMMDFLKSEVEGSERIRLARQPFSSTNSTTRTRNNKPAVAAAASLIVTEAKEDQSCVFCGGRHLSQECRKAEKMSLENRRKQVKEKHRCFTCLKSGHGSWTCKEKVKCECCGKSHYALVCSGNSEKSANSDGTDSEDKTIDCCNQLRSPEVPLQTVLVKIQNGNKEKIVRALMDNGSQRSYILKSTAKELSLESKGERETTHLTFGGGKHTKYHYHYDIELVDMDSKFSRKVSVDDETSICSHVPEASSGKWILELKRKGVILNDQKYQHSNQTVEVLLGNDVYGRLLTGKKVDLNCGITALETVFGWTLSGEIPDDGVALSCHVRDVSLQDSLPFDVIGIRVSMKEKTKEEVQQAALQVFRNTFETVHILGLTCGLQSNDLSCDLSKTFKRITNKLITKRIILPIAYFVYDPIGAVNAYTIVPKMLLQESYKLKSGWDTSLPEELFSKFTVWMKQLYDLELHTRLFPGEVVEDSCSIVLPAKRNLSVKEYLALLVSHGKSNKYRMVKVGELVLVGSDTRKRIDWLMKLMVEVYPGKDLQARVVLVKTAGGILL